MKYPRPKEPGYVDASYCEALDGGWLVIYDRQKGGPAEFDAAVKAGNKAFERGNTGRYVVLYRPDPDEVRTWAKPGRWVGTAKLGEARKWSVAIAKGDDDRGVLPVADGALLGGLNQRQFLYAQLRLSTDKSQAECYVLAGFKSKTPSADAQKLEKKSSFIQYMERHRSVAVKKFTLTRDEFLADLQQVWQKPVGEIDETSQYAQEVEYKPDGSKRVKTVPKSWAGDTIKDMLGWGEQEKALDKMAVAIQAAGGVLKDLILKKKGK